MNIEKYLAEMIDIQQHILEYLDDETNSNKNYQNLKDIFEKINIHDNQYELKSLLHLLLKISNNHHQKANFFDKIDQLLQLFKDDIKRYYSNSKVTKGLFYFLLKTIYC